MEQWLKAHEGLLLGMFLLSLLTLLAAVFLLPVLLARMPSDYFVRKGPPPGSWRDRHPVVRVAARAAKNILGALLVLVGIPLIPLPGQGLVTVFAGLALLEFPGKRRVELRIVRLPGVLRGVNWLRARAGKPPLLVDGAPGKPPRDPAQGFPGQGGARGRDGGPADCGDNARRR